MVKPKTARLRLLKSYLNADDMKDRAYAIGNIVGCIRKLNTLLFICDTHQYNLDELIKLRCILNNNFSADSSGPLYLIKLFLSVNVIPIYLLKHIVPSILNYLNHNAPDSIYILKLLHNKHVFKMIPTGTRINIYTCLHQHTKIRIQLIRHFRNHGMNRDIIGLITNLLFF